ncbi:MAG: hypothetical protein JZU47_10115 [Prolixibacteraceae bacterium]|nr:hypothetical protein [Prolixibacteraceae bacterium]
MAEEIEDETGKIAGNTNSNLGSEGKIAGITANNDGQHGKISGNHYISGNTEGKIPGDGNNKKPTISESKEQPQLAKTTRKERILKSTKEKGLKLLPINFGDSDGDWQIIESENLFEILYLDPIEIKLITPEVIQNNYSLICEFWKGRIALWESGSGQVSESIENRFTKKNLENCITKLNNAYKELSSFENIDEYYKKLERKRLDSAKKTLLKIFENQTRDEDLSDTDFEILFEMKNEIDISEEEIVNFIFVFLTQSKLVPVKREKGKGWVRVNENFSESNIEKITSFTWMTENKIKNQPPPIAIEIFSDIFAESIEEIGAILFDNEEQARILIKKGLLPNPVGVFSQPKALKISDICESKEPEYLKYLRTIYLLNPKLPYRFEKEKYSDLKSLTSAFFNELKLGKEHFKQGNIEIWLQETQKENYQKLIRIKDTAENPDLAFLELLYTFNPELPFRFSGNILVKSPIELCNEIEKNKDCWNTGKDELYNSSILIWLRTTGNISIVGKWDKVKDEYSEKKDLGLEYFLHLLNEKLPDPSLELNVKAFSYPQIQSGESVVSELVLSNKTRGFISGNLTLSKPIEGVALSSKNFSLNVAEKRSNIKVDLKIESKELLKGVDYSTDILITTTNKQEIVIPISFRIVFPKKAFINELVKYSILFGLFGLILRGIIYAFGFHNWLNTKYNYYLHPADIFWQEKPTFYYFPIILLIFILLMLIISIFWKPIKRTLTLK